MRPPASTPLPTPPAERTEAWVPSTLRLSKAEISLFAALGDAAQRRHSLVRVSGAEAGTQHVMAGPRMLIGRAPDCALCLDSPGISRLHAELFEAEGGVWLRDLGSSNGTWLNERRVDAAARLRNGDLLRLGNLIFKFYERDSLDALLHERLYRLATVDAGTGCFTKQHLLETLEREVGLARRRGRPLALLALDLDRFKAVNDRFGHNAGDEVLRGVAAAARGVLREGDCLGRVGGEELAAVLPDTGLPAALEMAERMRQAVAAQRFELQRVADGARVPHVQTASFGVALLAPAMAGARDLLGAADERLYAAKHAGRNRVAA